MAAESAAFYYGRLVGRLNKIQARQCRECPGRLTCAVNEVLHPSDPKLCGCSA